MRYQSYVFKTALELDPNSSVAHMVYGHFLELLARFDEAIVELKRAEELDPLSVLNMFTFGVTYFFSRQYASATKEFLKALEIEPNSSAAHAYLGRIHLAQERYEEA